MNSKIDDAMSVPRFRVCAIVLTIAAVVIHVYVWKHESPTIDIDGKSQRDYAAIRFADERNYYVHCADCVAEEGILYLAEEDSLRSPPLPWAWLLLFGRNVALTRAANILSIIAASWLIASIVRDRWGGGLALVAFALCALGYQVVSFSATVLTEPMAFTWVCAALWSAHRADARNHAGYVILTGVLTAIAAYARPSLQLWPFAVVFFYGLFTLLRRRQSGSDSWAQSWTWRRVVLLVVVHSALLSPWIIKNAICFGVPRIANGVGAVFYLGSEFRTDGDEPIFSGMNWPNHKVQGPGGHMSLDGEKRLSDAAMENIRAHPIAWASLCFRKMGRTLIGGPKWHFYPSTTLRGKSRIDGLGESALIYVWWTLLGTFVTVSGLFGIALRLRKVGFVFLFGLSLVAYMVLLHGVTFALPRFAVPLWPVFVLGTIGLFAVRPRRLALGASAFVSTAIVLYLTFSYGHRPSCEVSADRASFFTITAERSALELHSNVLTIDLDGRRPAYNTCIFVKATVISNDGKDRIHARLRLTPADKERPLAEESAIGFPLLADNREHTYMLCTELNPAWRDRKWGAVHIEIDAKESERIKALSIQIGH